MGSEGEFRLVGFEKRFEIGLGGFGWINFGDIQTDNLGLDGAEEALQPAFSFLRKKDGSGGEGIQ